MQGRQTTGEVDGSGSTNRAAMGQAGADMDMDMGGGGGLSPMEQTFTYEAAPGLKFDITVTVKPYPPPSAGMIGGGGTRPKDRDD